MFSKPLPPFEELKTKQRRFLKRAGGSSLFWTEQKILGGDKNLFRSRHEKARKSCEHGSENSKQKFNSTRRKSDNGGSARVDCHNIQKKKINTFKDDMASENTKKSMPHAIVVLRKVKNRAELEQHLFLKHCKPGGGGGGQMGLRLGFY